MVRPDPKTQYLNEVPEFQERRKKRGYWVGIVEDFIKRPEKCMVLGYDHIYYADTAFTAIRNRIATDGLKMQVKRSDCTVYVIKEDGDEAKAR